MPRHAVAYALDEEKIKAMGEQLSQPEAKELCAICRNLPVHVDKCVCEIPARFLPHIHGSSEIKMVAIPAAAAGAQLIRATRPTTAGQEELPFWERLVPQAGELARGAAGDIDASNATRTIT